MTRLARAGAATLAVLLTWVVAGALLPSGLPFGVIVLGLVLGGLFALTAMGLVLVYRSSRIINFAQVEIGGLAATVAQVMVRGWHQSYFLAVPIGILVALGTGAVIDVVVVRRFFNAPRLILTVATIGVLQILGAAEIRIPTLVSHNLRAIDTFRTPFHARFTVGPIVFSGDHVLVMVAVPVILLGLAWFFSSSDIGIAVRAAADSNERALLLGIPVRRLSTITWVLAAGLSGVAAILAVPILGTDLGVVGGPVVLLAPLAAAVIARMESLPVAVAAGLGIGVFQQAVFWNYPRSSTVDVGLFVIILVALLLQRRRVSRVDDAGLGGYVAVREVRPVPAALRDLPEVRWGRTGLLAALAVVAVLVPFALSTSRVILLTDVALYGIIAVSLVVLTGWAGQISLGQFAFVGLGAAVTGSLLVHAGADFLVAVLVAALVGAVAAVLVGIPALRIQGLFLAVATLAFAVPVSTYLLNSRYFPTLNPSQFDRPILLQRFNLEDPLTFYFVCVGALLVSIALARNFRRSRAGRAVVGVRDNERGAAAFAISPVRAKLTAFAFSGALAGFAGAFYAVSLRGIPFSGFDPVLSIEVFTAVVVGGLGSIPGALLGAAYVEGVEYFLTGAARLLATGGGLLVLLMVIPGGLGEVMYNVRDRILRLLAARRGLSVPSLAEHPAFDAADLEPAQHETPTPPSPEPVTEPDTEPVTEPVTTPPGPLIVSCQDVDASYGQIQVLFGVDLAVENGEIVALLGTNGAGKSTVLRVVAGLLRPHRGRVVFDGEDITGLDPVARVKRGLVTVPGGRGVFGSLSVAENLRLAAWLARHDTEFVEQARARIFQLFPALERRLGARASDLSGGEQQMLTLAQALLCRPRLLLIDELSLGLAPTVVATLIDVVRQINAGGTSVVVVEQSVNVATGIASRAEFMEKGQVRFSGPTAELAERPDLLRSVFLSQATANTAATPAGPAPPSTPKRPCPATPTRANNGHARLEVAGVSRRFAGVVAVDAVDLRVEDGQILGVIGSNGAGKTTLFDLCSGFLAADAGRVVLDGRDVTELGAPGRADLGIGRSFQDARLFPSMTVTETIATALERHVAVREPTACAFRVGAVADSEGRVAERVEQLLETMGLQRYRDAFVSELSTGTRRIVELSCAIAHEPRVLLLDEPSSGIAQRETEALGELLLQLRDATGASLAIIEHDIPMVTSIADELVCLHLGHVIARGTPAQVLDDPEVVSSYLGTSALAIERSGSAGHGARDDGGR
ncbi:MAG: ATP-binding cassette domain-containing protein [Acidimicrobiia bacterium]|nr:ATP-binding cassette domain-containing protein [Acidimicrobiia bacterium]